jgi:hypothetical protein
MAEMTMRESWEVRLPSGHWVKGALVGTRRFQVSLADVAAVTGADVFDEVKLSIVIELPRDTPLRPTHEHRVMH